MDGDASLLDKTLIDLGLADGGSEHPQPSPRARWCSSVTATAMLKGNVHLKAAADTPMANVLLTLMHNLGLDDVKSIGDSTGEFSLTTAGLDSGCLKNLKSEV